MNWLAVLAAFVGLLLFVVPGASDEAPAAETSPGRRLPLKQIMAGAVLFVLTGVMVAGLTAVPVLALIAAFAAGVAPVYLHRSHERKHRKMCREQWPEVIHELISMVRSGASLPAAWVRLGERGFPGISGPIERSVATYRATGSFVAALDDARCRFGDPVADQILLSLKMAHEVGGTDLIPVLRTLVSSVASEMAIRREVEARWAWTVSSARVAAAAPWLVLFVMLSRPETVTAYARPEGGVVLLIAAAASVLGYSSMLRAARLPGPRSES